MKEQLLEIIKPILGNAYNKTPEDHSTPLDSLKVLQIIMALDEAGFSIPMEHIASIRSVNDILNLAASDKQQS